MKERPTYEDALRGHATRIALPGRFPNPASRTLTAGRPTLRGHFPRKHYRNDFQSALQRHATRWPTRMIGACPLRLPGEQDSNRRAASVSKPGYLAQASNSAPSTGNHSSSSDASEQLSTCIQVTSLVVEPRRVTQRQTGSGDSSSLDSRGFPLWRRERTYNPKWWSQP